MVFKINLTSAEPHMSTHSYSRLWTHLIWETLNREPMLDKQAAAKASSFLTDYSLEKGIYMKINYFNADRRKTIKMVASDAGARSFSEAPRIPNLKVGVN